MAAAILLTLAAQTASYTFTIDPAGAREVELRWSVPLDHRTLDGIRGRDEYEYPYLAADHGMLVMATMALVPGEGTAHDREFPITIEFDLPSGWEIHLNDVRDDLVAIGQWDTYEEEVDGMAVTFAFAPGQETLKQGVVQQAAPIVAGMIDHFGGKVQDRYLVLFGEPQPGGYGGSPKTNSMTLFLSPELPLDFALDGMVHLIAHEFHHTWMRARCRPVDELRFVAEGFTDYFAYFIPWRIGAHDDARFRAEMEQKLAKAELAQAGAGMTLQQAGGPAFFQGGPAHQFVYGGGLMLGFWLDLALRQPGEGQKAATLEELLRRFYNHDRWQEDLEATPEHLWADLRALGRADLAARVQELTTSTEPIDWVAAFAEIGVDLQRELVPAPLEVRANFEGTTITAIDPAGTGGRLGLRAGDELLEVNGNAVFDEGEVREAFEWLVDGGFAITFERDGERRMIAAPRPQDVVYTLPEKIASQLATQSP
jgi:predicted metalloprotease with PDZ domain